MAEVLGDTETQQKYLDILNKGKEAFERMLWNGGCSAAGSPCFPWEGRAPPCIVEPCGKWGKEGAIMSLQAGGKEGRCCPSKWRGRSRCLGRKGVGKK